LKRDKSFWEALWSSIYRFGGLQREKIYGNEACGMNSTAHLMIETSTTNLVVFYYGLKFLVSNNYPA
jgi:hypothetical protein